MLGCIADDVTGATDLATNLVQGGARVVQWLAFSDKESLRSADADAIVISLKTRSVSRQEAIRESLSALDALRRAGCARTYFKYCSTFDSTAEGNIGPVAEALLAAVQAEQTIFCPAFPETGRTVYQGHLFVGDRLLSESGMEDHPLNPMKDPNLLRVLRQQSQASVGLISYADISPGVETMTRRMAELAAQGVRLVITDCCDDRHLETIAQLAADLPLVTGGSALARFLPSAYRQRGMLAGTATAPSPPEVSGRTLIVAGSCSAATQRQVNSMKRRCPSLQVDVESTFGAEQATVERIVDWASQQDISAPVLVYSTAPAAVVQAAQQKHGRTATAAAAEYVLSHVARALVKNGDFRRIIVAGGETAGAVVRELGISSLRIGPRICAGVPWTQSTGKPPVALALKSGNFGSDDFFQTALEMLS